MLIKPIIVENLDVTQTGFEVKSIDDVIDQQNNSAQQLYSLINE